ncbi:MAG: 4Fe-4S binding protein [Ignavibacteriales bacterium]|nr:4Fe-4S binding protein [Ignavibacteriales bacterium]
MQQEVYRQLAQTLDALPNRFPPTRSGVEFRLLAKLFTPEEAALACTLRLEPAAAADIANRAGSDLRETRSTLKRMVAKGLIDIKKGEGEFAYALRPFVVGFYEGQLPRMDAEMAELFEQYYHETEGGILRDTPSLHRIIPVGRAIPLQIDIHPFERATEILEGALSWGVRDCICRKQQQLLGKDCGHPLESCLVFAPVRNAFDRSTVDRAITKEEALRILRMTEDSGLVHSSGNYRDGIEYICNCCTCCCGIMRGIAEYGIMSAVARADFQIALDADSCTACGDCIERCQFHALSLSGAAVDIDLARCMGCGLCVVSCPTDGLHLERRKSGEVSTPPADIRDWRTQRSSRLEKAGSIP